MFFQASERMLRGHFKVKDSLDFRKLMLYRVENRGGNKILEESK
jgi:hypothetical protein